MDEKKSSIQQRCLFVAMLSVLLTDGGGSRQLLDGRTPEERKQMAEAWDLCQHTPVGIIINRPDFENLNEVKRHDIGKSNEKRLTEYSDGGNKRI